MSSSRSKSSRRKKQPQTTFSERTSSVRPYAGILLLGLGAFALLAIFFYDPKQPGWIEAFAESTRQDHQPHLLGAVGRDAAYLLSYLFGVGSYGLGVVLMWGGWLLLIARGHWLRWQRCIAGVLLVLLLSVGGSWMGQDGDAGPKWIQGWGGAMGFHIYDDFLRASIGPLLSAVITFFGAALLAIYFFRFPVRRLLPGFKSSGAAAWAWIRERRAGALDAWRERSAGWNREKPAEGERFPENPSRKVSWWPWRRRATVAGGEDNGGDPEWDEDRLLPAPNASGGKVRKPRPSPRLSPAASAPSSPKVSPPESEDPSKAAAKSSGLKIVTGEKIEKAKQLFPQRKGNYKFPPIDLLADASRNAPAQIDNHEETALALQQTLEEFGVKVELGEVHMGPVITRYEVLPAPGVRVERIANLEKNIGMALKAQSVRILAPVPGKGCVGVEVPNRFPLPVCLREIIESRAWVDADAEIPIVLGKEVSGKPLVADLTRMPHLLIAGSTGSGKTVCINSIIASLLFHSSPADLRFIMIDPKIVEMKVFNDLPHMLIPVQTDPKKVPGALKWLISEMERRYRIFAEVGVRNIAGFNAKLAKDRSERERAKEMDNEMTAEERAALSNAEVPRDSDVLLEGIPEEKLPYIVCLVDELADLMMVAPADIETCIARLAQLARAAGIHLIIATQRPSVNVITGVIKANLPSRISFKVASKIDSRTILDESGADSLIGKGDMLFVPPGAHTVVRAQGAFVSDEEINALVEYLKVNGPPHFLESVQEQIEAGDEEGGGPSGDWDDDLVPQALEVLRNSKRASTSMLQRRLKIGYNRAARIMEILEDEGYVGPENGAQPREILRDLDS